MKSKAFESKLLTRLSKLDASQIRQFLAQIVEQKQFLMDILDCLNEGVIVTDSSMSLLFANPKARSMLGLPRRRGKRENLIELIDPDNPLTEIFVSLRGHLREIRDYESPYGPRGDRYVSLTTLLMPTSVPMEETLQLPRPAHERSLMIILLQDVTERRLRLDEQARARRLASMATLTSGIAHEIKNPLNSLNIHAQLLREEAAHAADGARPMKPERITRAVEVILEETRRLGRIVDDFIQSARPTQPDLVERQLAPFIEHAADLFRPECRHAGITLIVNVEPDLPPIFFDEHLLLQALRNLVRNAIDALAEHREAAREANPGYTPTLEIAVALGGDCVNLSVIDNGSGIDTRTLEHVFEPYFTTKFHGTGLGLMVVYRIVTEHRGALHIDTQPGEGTRFTISLPLHHRPVRLLQEQTRHALEAGLGPSPDENTQNETPHTP